MSFATVFNSLGSSSSFDIGCSSYRRGLSATAHAQAARIWANQGVVNAIAVPLNKTDMLAFNDVSFSFCPLGEWSLLTTSTHTKTCWIGQGNPYGLGKPVALNEIARLAFDVSKKLIVEPRYSCLLAASTFAIAVGNFIRGIMGLHRKFAFLMSNPGTLVRRCPVFLLVFTPVIISFSGVNTQ